MFTPQLPFLPSSGTLSHVQIKLDSGKSIPIDRVEIKNLTTGADPTLFPSKETVSADSQVTAYAKAMLTHSASFVTKNSEFDGEVFVTLVCESGEAEEVQVLTSEGEAPTFITEYPISFNIKTFDLGKVLNIKVGEEGSGKGRGRQLLLSRPSKDHAMGHA